MVQIAYFGSPGSGKSTAINFLITGSLKGTLPNSSQKGEGCTKFPIRCIFKDINKIVLFIIKSDQKREFRRDFEASTSGMNKISNYKKKRTILYSGEDIDKIERVYKVLE